MTLKLAEIRNESYNQLWEIIGFAAPTRLDGWGRRGSLTDQHRRAIWVALTDWYYANGNGMLLGETTKTVYLNAKHNLVCPKSMLRPPGLADLISRELEVPVESELS